MPHPPELDIQYTNDLDRAAKLAALTVTFMAEYCNNSAIVFIAQQIMLVELAKHTHSEKVSRAIAEAIAKATAAHLAETIPSA